MATVELAIGDEAPSFEAEVTDGGKVSLSEILSTGRGVILYFYPRDNTPGCTAQACDFRDTSGDSKIVPGRSLEYPQIVPSRIRSSSISTSSHSI